jgi:hypothetical protein
VNDHDREFWPRESGAVVVAGVVFVLAAIAFGGTAAILWGVL